MRWTTLMAVVLLTVALAAAQSTYERKTFSRIEDTNSGALYDDAAKQSVIMRLDTAVALDSGDVWTSDDLKLQNLRYGYPTRANLICDLSSGSFSAVWRENYGLTWDDTVHFQGAQAPDSAQVIIATTSPWTATGVWRWFTDFGGGSTFYYVITAHEDATVLDEIGVQLIP